MMEKVADFYEDEVDLATEALTSAMEPLIIVVMAVVVGAMVVAIYSPILSMYDAVDSYKKWYKRHLGLLYIKLLYRRASGSIIHYL